MRVLVTGSHGFIGKNLVEALKERGDEVIEWDTQIEKDACRLVDEFRGNLDEVYNLACITQMACDYNPMQSRKVNALLPGAMRELANRSGARFVHTSTASVYGQAKNIPTSVLEPTNPLTVYARDKLRGEHYVKGYSPFGMYSIFRLSNVYGPHQTLDNPYCGVVGRFIEHASRGEPFPIIRPGKQTRDFTYVGDVVKHLMNPSLVGLFNCSHGKEISVNGVAETVREATGEFPGWTWIEPRSVDKITRRCLISDVSCPTKLADGINKTLKWRREAGA